MTSSVLFRDWFAAAATLIALLAVAAPSRSPAVVQCGDCNTDDIVSIDEVISAVSNALAYGSGQRQRTGPFETIPAGYIVETGTHAYVVRRAIADLMTANLERILEQARVIPHFEGGQLAAYRLLDVPPGSFLDQLGLKQGDFIEELNGEPVPADARDIGAALSADAVAFRVRRSFSRLTLHWTITP